MKHLSDDERSELVSRILAGLRQRGESFEESGWLTQLVIKVAKRSPRHEKDREVRKAFLEMGEEPPDWSPRDEDWYREVCGWSVDEMVAVRTKEDYEAIERVAVLRDDAAFSDMLDKLNGQLKIKGMLYNRGADPEEEYPKVQTKIWEAMSKWDGRDFTAYIARTIKNYCIDRLKAKKKAMAEMPETVADPRPASRTRDQAETRDALGHVLSAIEELESKGTVGPLDGALFSLIMKGRGVTELVGQLVDGPVVAALDAAHGAIGAKKKLSGPEALTLSYLLEGLTAAEAAMLTGCEGGRVEAAAAALAPALADAELALALCREGATRTELGRAAKITANAINLRVNRMRLKIWGALVDRGYEGLARRESARLDAIDKAIIQFRCQAQGSPPCRMYKDRSCKREAPLAEIIVKGQLSISEEALGDRMEALRDRILDEVGRMLPDYNSCLFERKAAQ